MRVAQLGKTGESEILINSRPELLTQEVIAGLVKRITFHNAENGFLRQRAKVRDHRDLATIVGRAAIISAAEWITASGEWINDRAPAAPGSDIRPRHPAVSVLRDPDRAELGHRDADERERLFRL
jgi:hypothetical protein